MACRKDQIGYGVIIYSLITGYLFGYLEQSAPTRLFSDVTSRFPLQVFLRMTFTATFVTSACTVTVVIFGQIVLFTYLLTYYVILQDDAPRSNCGCPDTITKAPQKRWR